MSRIITFLGQTGTAQTTLAIATARWFAQQNQRTLLVTACPSATAELLLETSLTPTPQDILPNLQSVQLQTTLLLDEVWDEVKKWLALYVPDSISIDVYPSEVVILPGFDSVLGFNALRKYFQSGAYDVIVYDGKGDLETLRMLGIPDMLDWYFRRFRRVFDALDLGKIAESIGGPIASALLAANMDSRKVQDGLEQIRDWISKGVAVLGDARRLTAYLVVTEEMGAIATAQWLWGSSQQIDLRVSGVLAYGETADLGKLQHTFTPLQVHPIPALDQLNWKQVIGALPDFNQIPPIPEPISIDVSQRWVRVFLPGFAKHQVKLTQLGPELTVEAGNQRRNILLPPELQGQPVMGGKFEAPYLIISF